MLKSDMTLVEWLSGRRLTELQGTHSFSQSTKSLSGRVRVYLRSLNIWDLAVRLIISDLLRNLLEQISDENLKLCYLKH